MGPTEGDVREVKGCAAPLVGVGGTAVFAQSAKEEEGHDGEEQDGLGIGWAVVSEEMVAEHVEDVEGDWGDSVVDGVDALEGCEEVGEMWDHTP